MEAQRLRELMRQEKAKRNRPPPKFAVWREAGQLQCQICKALVNSENLWATHLRSVPHLRVLETLRRQLEEKKRAEADAAARKQMSAEAPERESEEAEAETAALPVPASPSAEGRGGDAEYTMRRIPASSARSQDADVVSNNTRANASSSTSLQKECTDAEGEKRGVVKEEKEDDASEAKRIRLMGPLLPTAFHVDQITLAEVEEVDEKAEAEAEELTANGIPEGFFDDEDEEAKARGVKKPAQKREERMEIEMRKFEAQIEKEDQRMHAVRQDLDQVAFNLQSEEEKMLVEELKERAKHMRDEVDRIRKLKQEKEESSDSGSDADETLLEVNWRTKGL